MAVGCTLYLILKCTVLNVLFHDPHRSKGCRGKRTKTKNITCFNISGQQSIHGRSHASVLYQMPFCTRIHRGAVEIYYTGLICFWRVIVFLGGPYRFTGFCCIWNHHEILVCSDIKNCMREAMEIADKKEDEIVFVWYWKHGTAEGSFMAKKWFGHRAGRSPWVTFTT